MFRIILSFAALLVATRTDAATLAVVAPEKGPFALLGAQVFAGAERLAEERKLTLARIPESCEAGGGEEAAKAIIAAKAGAAIGFLCSETMEGGAARLKQAGVPAISLSVRSKILFEDAEKEGWPLFTLAPDFEQEADKLAAVIVERWQGAPFAIVDDGALPSRELVEAVRGRLEETGLKAQFSDTFRPGLESQIALVRRVAKTGATHVLFGGDRNDAAIIARDAAAEGVSLQLLGGEALNAANQPVALPDGVQAVLTPERTPATQAVEKALAAKGVVAEGYVLPAYAAASIAGQAMDMAVRAKKPAAETLRQGAFETVLGPFSFGGDAPRRNPYLLMEWKNGAFAPAETAR